MWLFLAVPCIGLRPIIVVVPGKTRAKKNSLFVWNLRHFAILCNHVAECQVLFPNACKNKLTTLLTFCVWETPQRAVLQIVKIQMRCTIILHFIRVFSVCKGKKRSSDKWIQYFLILPNFPRYVQWTIPSLLFQSRRKNPLVFKGLKVSALNVCSSSILLLLPHVMFKM